MIAAVNIQQKVVWGIGLTEQAAIDDAHNELRDKSEKIRRQGLGKLECFRLKKNAPLELCGEALFDYCNIKVAQKQNSTNQKDLFDIHST